MGQPVNEEYLSDSDTDLPIKLETEFKKESGVKIKMEPDQDIPFIPRPKSKLKINPKLRENGTAAASGSAADTVPRSSIKFSELGPPLINYERIEVRVAQKEKIVRHGLDYLEGLTKLMEHYLSSLPECREWLNQLNAVIAQASMPRVLVGLVGETGAGKSSMVNALIGEEGLIPCNAMRACTAVPVEIAYNTSDDPAELYRGEIEFVSQDEWETEFKILTDDIRVYNEDDDIESKQESSHKISSEKLAAVYHGVPEKELARMTPGQLSTLPDLSHLLGKTKIVKGDKPKQFSKAIVGFIDSSNKGSSDGPAYWPLIRRVKIYTKASLLKYGLVLVDLPGLGDQNEARRRVTEGYIQNLHHMWIVAAIVRAVDNQIAQDLMGPSFKRQLLMDGRYRDNFLTFVMTKTDDITSEDTIEPLGLGETVLVEELQRMQELRLSREKCTKDIQDAKRQEKDIGKVLKPINAKRSLNKSAQKSSVKEQKQTRKRKLDELESSEPDENMESISNETQSLNEQRKKLLETRAACRKTTRKLEQKFHRIERDMKAVTGAIRTICIEQRNQWTQEKLQLSFQGDVDAFSQEIVGEGAGGTNQTLKVLSHRNLKTFCVSTKAYQQLCGNLNNESLLEGFSNKNVTQIPALREHARRSTLPERERIADKAMTAMHLFNIRLKVWAKNKDAGELSEDQKQLLSEEVDKYFTPMVRNCRNALEIASAGIQSHRKISIDMKLQTALVTCMKRAKKSCLLIALECLPVSTFKAICTRNGVYKTKSGVFHNWTESLANAILKPLAVQWDKHFNEHMNKTHQIYKQALIEELQRFLKELEKSFSRICVPSYKPLEGVLSQIQPLQKQVKESINASFEFARSQQKDIHREIPQIIVTHMHPGYLLCKSQKGKGARMRMNQLLVDYIAKAGPAMYQECAKLISSRLDDTTTMIARRLDDAATNAYNKLEKDLSHVINDPDAQNSEGLASEKRIELQKAVLGPLNSLLYFWGTLKEPAVQSRPSKKGNFEVASEEEYDDNSNADSQDEDSQSGSEDSDSEASDEDS